MSVPAQAPKITYVTLFADESIHPKYEAAIKKLSKSLGKHYRMHIGDEAVVSKDGEFAVRSPIDTSIVVGYFPVGQQEARQGRHERREQGLPGLEPTPWKQRVKILLKTAELMDERKFEIAAAITYEVGKNRTEALAEVWEAIDAIRVFAKSMEENDGYIKKMGPGGPGEDCTMVMKPYGVWPVISPFNFPFMLANGMASGALITGNTVVLKPTSAAPLTGLMLYHAYRDAGVPAGAVNFVTGPGANYEKEFTQEPARRRDRVHRVDGRRHEALPRVRAQPVVRQAGRHGAGEQEPGRSSPRRPTSEKAVEGVVAGGLRLLRAEMQRGVQGLRAALGQEGVPGGTEGTASRRYRSWTPGPGTPSWAR